MEVGQIFNPSSITYVRQMPLMPQPMMSVSNPFAVTVDGSQSHSLDDGMQNSDVLWNYLLPSIICLIFLKIANFSGITVRITCQTDCVVHAFWGVNISELRKSINNHDIYRELVEGNFMLGSFLYGETQTRLLFEPGFLHLEAIEILKKTLRVDINSLLIILFS